MDAADTVTIGITDAARQVMDRLVGAGDIVYYPETVRDAIRQIYRAWIDAVLGKPDELMTLAPADLVSFLLGPPTGLGKQLRLVVVDPKVVRVEVKEADTDVEPPALKVESRIEARWWVENPETGNLSRGYTDADTEVWVSWTIESKGPGSGPAAWRLTRSRASTQEEIFGYRFVTRQETPGEYLDRTGDRSTPTASTRAVRRYRISGDWSDSDFKIGDHSELEVETEGFPSRFLAEQLLLPVAVAVCERVIPDVEDFRPSFSSIQVVELLESGGQS